LVRALQLLVVGDTTMTDYQTHSDSLAHSKSQTARWKRIAALTLLAGVALPLIACSSSASPTTASAKAGQATSSSAEQKIVERSAAALEKMRKNPRFARANFILEDARGVMIFPQLVKASAIIGGEGGSGVLVVRKADGGWSDPAFYSVGSPSIGLQLGYQQATVVLFIMDQPTLERALHSSFTLGTKSGATLGYVGDNDRTRGKPVSANIYQLVDADGVFAGVSLDGYVIGARSQHNRDYYGRPTTPRQILLEGAGHKPEAGVLDRALALK
jgi:lipid-binding SYLF domain-containing protein